MKILYLSNSKIPSQYANSVHVMKMCSAIAKLGHEVKLYAKRTNNKNGDAFTLYGVEPDFLISYFKSPPQKKRTKVRNTFFRHEMRMRIKRISPDIIYSRNHKALSIIGTLGKLFILEEHTIPNDRGVIADLFKLPNFKRLVVISESLKKEFLKLFSLLKPNQVIVAHDASDPVIKNKNELKIAGGFNVGYVGSLYPGKGMEIIGQLLRICPWAHFHIVGGSGKDLTKWKAQLSSMSNITFYGHVYHPKAMQYISCFDVVIAPYQEVVMVRGGIDISRWMSPIKIFEYMACGKPMVVTDLPVLREVLRHEKNALLVPPDDINIWSQALKRYLEDEELRNRLSQQAMHDFERNYTWKDRAKKVLNGLEYS